MKANPVLLKAIAGGVLVAGAAAAYTVAQAPAKPADLSTVRALSSKLQGQPAETETTLSVPQLNPGPGPQVPVRPQPAVKPVAPPKPAAAPKPEPAPKAPEKTPAPAPAPAPVPESPVKNIALVGVTHTDQRATAWLVDTSSNQREEAAQGASAFGFTIKNVEDDAVVLERAGQDYTVRMGEKQVQVASADPVSTTPDAGGDFGGGFGNGRGRRGGFGQNGFGGGGFGQNGFGGRSRGFGGFGGRSFGGRGFGGGGSTSGGSGGSDSAMVFGGGNSGSSGFQGRGFQSGSRGGRGGFSGGGGGGYSGGGFSGGGGGGFQGFQGRQGGGSNPFSSASTGTASTSNPQTARRNGSTLAGGFGGGGSDAPAPITNPQTQRRLGTSSANQPAFGQQQQQGGGYGQGRMQTGVQRR